MATTSFTNTFIQSQAMTLKKVFDKSSPEAPPLFDDYFNVWDGDQARSFFQILPIYGFGPAALKIEGGAVLLDQGGEGTPSMFPYSTFGLKYGVTLEGRLEDPQGVHGRFPRLLRFAEDQTVEYLVWNILNQAFNTAVTIWDGQPLCSTAHTLAGAPGVTYSNSLGATSLTPETWQQATILAETLPDDRNLGIYRTLQDLVVPPGLHRVAEEIIGSPYYPYSAENRKNIAYEKARPIVSRYITAPTTGPFPWFASAGKGEIGSDSHMNFVSFKFRHNQEVWYDNDTRTMYHSTIFRLTFGSGDGRGIVGSQGA
jgi:hypothetical protein